MRLLDMSGPVPTEILVTEVEPRCGGDLKTVLGPDLRERGQLCTGIWVGGDGSGGAGSLCVAGGRIIFSASEAGRWHLFFQPIRIVGPARIVGMSLMAGGVGLLRWTPESPVIVDPNGVGLDWNVMWTISGIVPVVVSTVSFYGPVGR